MQHNVLVVMRIDDGVRGRDDDGFSWWCLRAQELQLGRRWGVARAQVLQQLKELLVCVEMPTALRHV